jgi:NAD(P)-dependent dehydrogenase (short-subunit alcohol dehydrogenase family)
MSDKIRYVRQLSPESAGEAPGRGRLKGRKILVVGGGQRTFDAATDPVGNGRAMSLLFAREGAHVAVADLNRASADDTVQRITADGGQAFSIEANIAREDDVNRMIDEAVEGLGGLDGMVLNVGIGVGALGLDRVDHKDWNDTFAVNLTGPMLCCRKALKHIADGSSIVFISSIAALRSGSQLIAYDASKAALGGLKEGAKRGIRANIIYPGLVDTPLGRHTSAGHREARRACRSGGWRRAGKSPTRRCFSSPTRAFTSTRRRWRSTAASPGYEPKSGEKISSAGRSIGAINPLPKRGRTKRALLFSQASRLVSRVRPFSGCALVPPAPMEDVRCDRFVHFCATPRPGSDGAWPRLSPSPPPACRPPARKARVPLLLRDQV